MLRTLVRAAWIGLLLSIFAFIIGCNQKGAREITGPETPQYIEKPNVQSPSTSAVGPAWEANIVSEAFYALSQSRSGGSSKTYQGYAMSDWPYPLQGDCCDALTKVTVHTYGSNCPPCRGPLGLWAGQYQQCGWCKFFVNLVLYRSSYGYPGGHIVLRTGYYWNPGYDVRNAQPGWIIQADGPSGPHTAIVVANLGWGLDVIDANWVGTYRNSSGVMVYSYAIARHPMSWSTLSAWGFRAYRAHEVCTLIP